MNLTPLQRAVLVEAAAHPDVDTAALWEMTEEQLGRGVSVVSFHVALEELQEAGLVEKEQGEIVAERGMRPRIRVQVTRRGQDALATFPGDFR
jgi:DNA-binding PadR family transcriptional regulator